MPSEQAAALVIATILSGEREVADPTVAIARIIKERITEDISEEAKARIAAEKAARIMEEAI